MKVLMVGRGVIASIYGWALERAGHEVHFLVRSGRVATYASSITVDVIDGRRCRSRAAQDEWSPRLREQVASDDDFDVVVLSVAHQRLADAVESIAPRVGSATVLMLSNVWAEPADLLGGLPAEQVVWGFPQAGGGYVDGVLRGALMPRVVLGRAGAKSSGREKTIRALLRSAGIGVREIPDMRGWLWAHMIADAGMHAQGLQHGTLSSLIGDRRALNEALLTSRELLPLLAARGVELARVRGALALFRAPSAITAAGMAWATVHVGIARASLAAHTDPEAEEPRAVCRDVLAEARRLGVPAPRLEAAEPLFAVDGARP